MHIVLVDVCERKQERVNIMWKGRLSERCTVGRLVCTAALVSDAEENLRYKRIFKISTCCFVANLVTSVHLSQRKRLKRSI